MARLVARRTMEIFCNNNGGISIRQDSDGLDIPESLVTFDYHDVPVIMEMIQNACEEAKGLENATPKE